MTLKTKADILQFCADQAHATADPYRSFFRIGSGWAQVAGRPDHVRQAYATATAFMDLYQYRAGWLAVDRNRRWSRTVLIDSLRAIAATPAHSDSLMHRDLEWGQRDAAGRLLDAMGAS
jgi:hypothetical protein